MAGNFNSKLILAKNILLDKAHKNVLNYNNSNMLALLRSNGHLVAEASNYSFIQNGKISVGFTYNQCLTSNYIAFQNPNYSNKWFFAFVDKVEYSSNNSTIIYYTLDNWATWFDNLIFKPCFVVREHVNDDTIGLHTLPEGLELGDFVINSIDFDFELQDLTYVILTNKKMDGSLSRKATSLGGIWTPGYVYVTDDITTATNIIASYQSNPDDIYAVYVAPSILFDQSKFVATLYEGNETPIYWGDNITKPTQLDGYTPTNKKLLTYPYSFLNVSNNNGTMNTYQYEYFMDSDCEFIIKGVPTIGCSIKLTPTHYKNTQQLVVEDEGIMAGKYPTCAWSQDYYTNWLTQNAVNVSTSYKKQAFSTLGNIAGSLISASTGNVALSTMFAAQGVSSATSFGGSILENMKQQTLAEMHPNSVSGNINGGDINTADMCNTFYFYKMSIKREYAEIIDKFFTKFGYTVNTLKVPNITGRANFNYIEIGHGERFAYGEVPPIAIDEINLIAQNGLTIWHNHANIGNFNISNNII